jgi:large subunit ribosomal protein L27
VRQRGTQFAAGRGVGLGSDYTIYATVTGRVKFDYASRLKKRVNVVASAPDA